MNMIKLFRLIPAALLVLGLNLSATSCSDDDDDNLSSEERREQAADQLLDPYEKHGEQAMALLQVVSQLADNDTLPDNWREATFEPTRGVVADASQPFVRWQAVSGAAEARRIFQSLSAQSIDANAPTAHWQADGVGQMTFTALNQPDCFATIDISVQQMPHLTQLRLVPATALGDNALSKKPYYRIGDVVQDKDNRYWVCVRSAGYDVNSEENKKTTHWISLQLTNKNLKNYVASSKRQDHIVPTALGGAKTEHLHYFAQLMWVLQHSKLYKEATKEGNVLQYGLGDLGADHSTQPYAYDYADVEFMAAAWDRFDLWSKVLPKGVTKESLIAGDSLCMFYNGYSSSIFSSKMKLFLCKQSGQAALDEQTITTVEWNMNDGVGFDINEYATNGKKGAACTAPGLPDRAIVVCQATGKDLADTYFEPDYDKPIAGVKSVYVANEGPLETYYHFGDIVKDRDGRYWFCVMPYDNIDMPESHWVTMQMLDENSPVTGFKANYTVTEAKEGVYGKHVMPANLNINATYAHYFAQLLYLFFNNIANTDIYDEYMPCGPLHLGKDYYDKNYLSKLEYFARMNNLWKKTRPGQVDVGFLYSSRFNFITGGYIDDGVATLSYSSSIGIARLTNRAEEVQWNLTGGVKFDVRDFEQAGHRNPENTTEGLIPDNTMMLCHATGTELAESYMLDPQDITKRIATVEDVLLAGEPVQQQ